MNAIENEELAPEAEAPRMENWGRVENGEKQLLRWMLWIAGGALMLALAGSWSMYGALSGLKQQVTDYHQQDAENSERNHQDIERLDNLLESKGYGTSP